MGYVLKYRDELAKAMRWLAAQEDTIFLGQGVKYPGHGMFDTLVDIPTSRRIELPVIEDAQMGISIGLAMQGYAPVSIYPRIDFLIIAMNQLVNHLDKFKDMTHGEYAPRVIIRTSVGSKEPLDGGIQHTGDYTVGLSHLLDNIDVVTLDKPEVVLNSYKWAYKNNNPTILIEIMDLYARS